MNNPPPSPQVVAMTRCNECGHQVPEGNLAIHQAHACGGRARRSAPNHAAASHQEVETPPRTGIRQRLTTAPPRDNANLKTKEEQVIDLAKEEEEDEDDDVVVVERPSNEWACPRCTLLNANSTTVCDACQYNKNSSSRAPDASHRERLVHPQQQQQLRQPPSPGAFVGAGALLGGVLGAAGAAMRGESWVGGLMEGSVSGAMGGAVLGSTTNQMAQQQQQQQQAAMARAQAQAAARAQPRSSVRVNRSDSGHHTTTTIFTSPDGRIQRRIIHNGGDPLMAMLMANAMQNSQQGMDIDGMSYEQLVQAFGDGTEHQNRGLDERVISSLPVTRVTEDTPPEQADCDHKSCPICLEPFKKGDSRMTLPCLHGFHEKCVTKWLRGNGSCPICKHSVSS